VLPRLSVRTRSWRCLRGTSQRGRRSRPAGTGEQTRGGAKALVLAGRPRRIVLVGRPQLLPPPIESGSADSVAAEDLSQGKPVLGLGEDRLHLFRAEFRSAHGDGVSTSKYSQLECSCAKYSKIDLIFESFGGRIPGTDWYRFHGRNRGRPEVLHKAARAVLGGFRPAASGNQAGPLPEHELSLVTRAARSRRPAPPRCSASP
jgi:hypothetical protein